MSTSREVLEEVDAIMEALGYTVTPDLYPFSGEDPLPVRHLVYTAYFLDFELKEMGDCTEHLETLIVDTWLGSRERLTQKAYREVVLGERDKVVDGLLGLSAAKSEASGSFEPALDGLTMRTRIRLPVVIERLAP